MRTALLLVVSVALLALGLWTQRPEPISFAPSQSAAPARAARFTGQNVYSTRTWANPGTLPDHFARHGADFGARDAEDYARQAYDFFQRAQVAGYPAKVDQSGTYRVYDPGSGAFGVYTADGRTKTYFKPGGRGYFQRQIGRPVDLRKRR